MCGGVKAGGGVDLAQEIFFVNLRAVDCFDVFKREHRILGITVKV